MSCAKQTVRAVITNNEQRWEGTNACRNPQETCPREGMESGEGYHLCREVCDQVNHAEVAVCLEAGESARGGTLTLHGHTYCCQPCLDVMEAHGIKEVRFAGA